MSACQQCGVDECSREHGKAHLAWEKAWLARLERDPKEPDGPGTFKDHLRRCIRFDEDSAAGRLSPEEFQRIDRELRAEGWRQYRAGLASLN